VSTPSTAIIAPDPIQNLQEAQKDNECKGYTYVRGGGFVRSLRNV